MTKPSKLSVSLKLRALLGVCSESDVNAFKAFRLREEMLVYLV